MQPSPHGKYDVQIAPYIKRGILFDTSIIKILLGGHIEMTYGHKDFNRLPEYEIGRQTVGR